MYRTNLLMDRLPDFFASVVVLGVVLYAVLTPNPPSSNLFAFPYSDKLVHFLMFGGLSATVIWDFGRRTGRAGWKQLAIIGAICGSFGFLTEWMQEVEGAGRMADWQDGVADVAGAFLVPLAFWSVIKSHTYHRRLRVSTAGKPITEKALRLYEQSFPSDERRERSRLIEVAKERKGQFVTSHIRWKGRFAGILYWWDFGSFVYIEHFAIDPHHRNAGLGGRALNQFTDRMRGVGKGVVLEAEPAYSGDMARRRVEFYQRHGFEALTEFAYRQPPYAPDKEPVELWLMKSGKCPPPEEMTRIIIREVYGAK